MNRFNFAATLLSLLVVACSTARADLVSGVSIPSPQVLDFESATLGSITASDSLFSSFGISDIGLEGPGNLSDGFGNRSNASRALWYNSGGLAIVDPGSSGNAQSGDMWFLEFSSLQTYFGFGFHDAIAEDDFRIEFFDDNGSVGTTEFDVTTADLEEFTFQSTVAFNRVEIRPPSTSGSNFGNALDNLTISAIPEASSFSMMGLVVVLISGFRRRVEIGEH
ncbi:MAG: hypothetical protein AAF497_11935 [Planctomycetota bacterium]